MVGGAREEGVCVRGCDLFEDQKIEEIAKTVEYRGPASAKLDRSSSPRPLTPIQQWFFNQGLPAPSHYNQSVLLKPTRPLDVGTLKRAIELVVTHHEALGTRFVQRDGNWHQESRSPKENWSFIQIDLRKAPDTSVQVERLSARLQTSLDISRGPLIRAAYFYLNVED